MSQTDGVAPEGGAEVKPSVISKIEPLIIYNCVQHREQNPIDCTAGAALIDAAQTYNAAIATAFPKSPQEMEKLHPLNFGGAGHADAIKTLPEKLDALKALARAEAKAQGVLTSNFERLVEATAFSAEAAELLATLEVLNAEIRELVPQSPWLGRMIEAPPTAFDQIQAASIGKQFGPGS